MAKYSPEELKELALNFLYLDGGGDSIQDQMKADLTLKIIQQLTGMSYEQIRYEIRKLAEQD